MFIHQSIAELIHTTKTLNVKGNDSKNILKSHTIAQRVKITKAAFCISAK